MRQFVASLLADPDPPKNELAAAGGAGVVATTGAGAGAVVVTLAVPACTADAPSKVLNSLAMSVSFDGRPRRRVLSYGKGLARPLPPERFCSNSWMLLASAAGGEG